MSERARIQEPCLCGDPECPLCFPTYMEPDAGLSYDQQRQNEVDDES